MTNAYMTVKIDMGPTRNETQMDYREAAEYLQVVDLDTLVLTPMMYIVGDGDTGEPISVTNLRTGLRTLERHKAQ